MRFLGSALCAHNAEPVPKFFGLRERLAGPERASSAVFEWGWGLLFQVLAAAECFFLLISRLGARENFWNHFPFLRRPTQKIVILYDKPRLKKVPSPFANGSLIMQRPVPVREAARGCGLYAALVWSQLGPVTPPPKAPPPSLLGPFWPDFGRFWGFGHHGGESRFCLIFRAGKKQNSKISRAASRRRHPKKGGKDVRGTPFSQTTFQAVPLRNLKTSPMKQKGLF